MATGWTICLLFLCLSVCTQSKREERAAVLVSQIAKFAIEELVSFGLSAVLEELGVGDEHEVIISKLDQILHSLNDVKSELDAIKSLINEIKSRQIILKALEIENNLRVLRSNYETVAKAIRAFDPDGSSATEQRELLNKDIEELTKALKGIPGLLTEFHLLITGESTVAAGRLAGLACEYVETSIAGLRTASAENYDVMEVMNKIRTYQDSLMSLQVVSFQLYNSTCADIDLTCKENEKKLESDLEEQEQSFQKCKPRLFQNMASSGYGGFFRIIHVTTHHALYTQQRSSIVRDGIVEWDKIATPQDAGLRCPEDQSQDELWSLVSSSIGGGYSLKQKQGCYLCYDQNFIAYEKSFPLVWTEGDRIDRKEFLICLPSLSSHPVQFLVSADEADLDSSYTLRVANKFLNVHVEKTSALENIDRRLVLVLFLDDEKANSWNILPDDSRSLECDKSATVPGSRSIQDEQTEDNIVPIIIGCCVGAVVIIAIVIGICCWCCRRDNY